MSDADARRERPGSELLSGWGRTAPSAGHVVRPEHLPGELAAQGVERAVRSVGTRGLIARGLGRSYNDAAQNAGGLVLRPDAGWLALDAERAVAEATAGTSIHDLIEFLVPRGFFPPVTPGTRQVTVGGAIAADVHGKNHHRHGSFGDHLISFELTQADGQTSTVSRESDPDLFWATVGGMGLTGIVVSARFRVLPVESGWMSVRTERLDDLSTVMSRLRQADDEATYSVAWIDTLATGRRLGRSVLSTGEHATTQQVGDQRDRWVTPGGSRLAAPPLVPTGLVSRPTIRAFNEAWFRKAPRDRAGEIHSIGAFFHPLDSVASWNRLYGTPGFVQYQCVVADDQALAEIVELVARAGHPSFLSVLKRFGPGNQGWLSFPSGGWTLALDLPTKPELVPLFATLDRIVVAAGGRVYLAKDGRVSRTTFDAMYERADDFRTLRVDRGAAGVFVSDLSRRLAL